MAAQPHRGSGAPREQTSGKEEKKKKKSRRKDGGKHKSRRMFSWPAAPRRPRGDNHSHESGKRLTRKTKGSRLSRVAQTASGNCKVPNSKRWVSQTTQQPWGPSDNIPREAIVLYVHAAKGQRVSIYLQVQDGQIKDINHEPQGRVVIYKLKGISGGHAR